MIPKSKLFHLVIFASQLFLFSCTGQSRNTGDPRIKNTMDDILPENYRRPTVIAATDTSPGWAQNGQRLLLTGTVLQPDGKTPAAGVIIYYYQTNTAGRYEHKPDDPGSSPPNSQGQTHGYIRGWVKTGADGKYAIYTVRPGTYPGRAEPAHVHATIIESDAAKSYYIDDFVFDDDILLTSQKRQKMENRGGSGVLRLVEKGELQIGERNIILGMHVPGHSASPKNELSSGKDVGEDITSFSPFHAWGPDKGSRVCPVCKYGRYHGLLYFVGDKPDWPEIKKWLSFLEAESIERKKYLKVYFIYGNRKEYDKLSREAELERVGKELNLQQIALTFVPSFEDKTSGIDLNRITASVENTFLLYKRSNVFAKFINLKATQYNFKMISTALDENRNEYFALPQPEYH